MNQIICVLNDTAQEGKGLRSEHGLAIWVHTPSGVVLFDSGQSRQVLTYNMKKLGLRMQDISALALSHGHGDHTGGLAAFLNAAEPTKRPLYAHPALFRKRFSRKEGEYQPIGIRIPREDLSQVFELRLTDKPVEILSGLWTTGEITARPETEGRSAGHFIHTDQTWQPDQYQDDLSLVLKAKAGLVLICGCCHAGLLNTLFHVERHFHESIHAIIGGTHLITASGRELRHIIDILAERYGNVSYYLNHCTGSAAMQALAERFGSRVNEFPAGAAVQFEHK